MADETKAKSAKERLAAAKQAAVDAEVVSQDTVGAAPQERARTSDEAREHAVLNALNAAEKKSTPEKPEAEKGAAPKEAAAKTEGTLEKSEKTEKPATAPEKPADKATATTDAPASDKAPEKTKDTAEANAKPKEPVKPTTVPAKAAPAGKSLAASVLQWLVIALVISIAALWAAPRIAPYLPGWAAPVATFLTPGADQATARIAEVEASAEAQITALSDRIAAMETALADTSGVNEAVSALGSQLTARIDAIEDAPKQDLSSLEATIDTAAGRVSAAEAALEGLRAEIDALNGITGSNAAPAAETLERVAAFGAAVEGLRSQIGVLSDKVAVIDTLAPQQEVSSLAARVDALEGGEAATANARDEADTIRRQANLDAALTRISQALAAGSAFDSPLGQAVNLSGEPAPDALESVAASGAPTTDSLIRSFGPAAQAGYAAALSADAGDGFGQRLIARLEGRIGGRPAIETQGDDAGAVLSRIEARLGEGRLDAARTEAAALPEDAASAMSGWLAALAKADDARRGLSDWRAALAAK